jgi:superfamily I DNA/RNA helicase
MTERADAEDRRQQRLRRLGTQNPNCVACGESDPAVLELHHIAGRKHHVDLSILCANCHRKASDRQRNRIEGVEASDRRLDRIGYYLLGLADLLEMVAGTFRSFGAWLIAHSGRSAQQGRGR